MLMSIVVINLILLALYGTSCRRNRIQKEQMDSEFREIVELSAEPLFVHRDGMIVYANLASAQLVGLTSPDELMNLHIQDFIKEDEPEFMEGDTSPQASIRREVVIQKTTGEELHLEAISSAIQFKGKPARKVNARDITEEKQKTEVLETFAFQDELTGLLNRRGFVEKVSEEIEQAKDNGNRFGVMFIDLDGFKDINDSLGHQVGDLVLQRVSDYLQACVEATDYLVARLGGDEFIILLPHASPDSCIDLAERIIEPQAATSNIFGRGAYVTPSIGIALSPENGEDIETLIQQADMAMYEAKKNGKNQYRFADTQGVAMPMRAS